MAGGMHGRGHVWQGACMAGGMHGRGGHAWQGVCMVGDMHGRGVCMVGGMHGGGMHGRKMAIAAGGYILLECILVFDMLKK